MRVSWLEIAQTVEQTYDQPSFIVVINKGKFHASSSDAKVCSSLSCFSNGFVGYGLCRNACLNDESGRYSS
jgi:hypothetical protein